MATRARFCLFLQHVRDKLPVVAHGEQEGERNKETVSEPKDDPICSMCVQKDTLAMYSKNDPKKNCKNVPPTPVVERHSAL